jgi:hypothetical protein
MPDDRYRLAFEAATEEVDELLKQVVEKKRFANLLAAKAGVEEPYEIDDEPTGNGAVASTIRADQFANYSFPSEAARAFLAQRGPTKGAVELDAIFDALQRGGFAWGSAKNDPKGGLRIALGKDGQVRRLANGTYGLWEWYPNAKRPSATVTRRRTSAASASADTGADDDETDDEEKVIQNDE